MESQARSHSIRDGIEKAMHPQVRTSFLLRGILTLAFAASLSFGFLCLEVTAMGPVREPAVAGMFYPQNPDELRKMIEEFLHRENPQPVQGKVMALLSPHAGYVYSGAVAASVYRIVQGEDLETVVVLAPSHRVPFRGASVLKRGAYRTPLGLVPFDEEVCRQLVESSAVIHEIPQAHGPEHSLEVQLPFLQIILQPGWKLVPIIMGSQDLQTARQIAEAIVKAVGTKRTLIVASSDLSHYHPAETAEKMDSQAIQYMQEVDAEGLWEAASTGRIEACGVGPALVALSLADRAGISDGKLVKYAHSGHVTGDNARVVGYAAMIWVKHEEANEKKRSSVGVDLGLTEEEKRTLKEIARSTIQCRLEGQKLPKHKDLSGALLEPRGAFVTLEKNHQLRGCIGFIEATKPLHATVQEMAEAAAFRDPRFPPLDKEEWPEVAIEISVLTPMRRIEDPSEIQVGKHGLYIVKGTSRGLLLPQVAVDYGWDRETFLKHTCTKAGLPEDAWKDPEAKIYCFSADIF